MSGDAPTAARRHYPRVLSIAGSDSGGGAGIQADLKTCAALGCYGMTAVTAITAQNTLGVRALRGLPAELVEQQIDAVAGDIGVDAVKIGMLHDAAIVRAVATAIRHHHLANVVLDPVMVASSGDVLSDASLVESVMTELAPLVTLITPNLDEAAWLLGRPLTEVDHLDDAARDLGALGAPAVLLKGGHLPGSELVDVLHAPPVALRHWRNPRIETPNTHGTGCTLSSAIACGLAIGLSLPEAVDVAEAYIRGALTAGAYITTGHGHGPLNHGFAPKAMLRLVERKT